MGEKNDFGNIIIPAEQVPYAQIEKEMEAVAGGAKASAAVMKAAGLPQVRGYLTAALDKAGATIERSAQVIAEAMLAEQKTYTSFEGQIRDERSDPDHRTRLKASELNLRARGELKDQDAINIFADLSDQQVALIAAGQLDPASLVNRGARIEDAAAAEPPSSLPPVTP